MRTRTHSYSRGEHAAPAPALALRERGRGCGRGGCGRWWMWVRGESLRRRRFVFRSRSPSLLPSSRVFPSFSLSLSFSFPFPFPFPCSFLLALASLSPSLANQLPILLCSPQPQTPAAPSIVPATGSYSWRMANGIDRVDGACLFLSFLLPLAFIRVPARCPSPSFSLSTSCLLLPFHVPSSIRPSLVLNRVSPLQCPCHATKRDSTWRTSSLASGR